MAPLGYETRSQRKRDHEVMQMLAFGADAHEVARTGFLSLIYDADVEAGDEGHARSCELCHDPIRGDWQDDLCSWCRDAVDAENEIDALYEASLP